MAKIADISPCLYYEDAAAAIEWLCAAFGLRRRLIVYGDGPSIQHCELSLGDTVVMVGDAARRAGHRGPRQVGAVSHGLSVFVADPDAHRETALRHGARITVELHDADYGARGYEVEDIEGHRWYFGTYRPGAHWRADGEATIVRQG